MTNAKTLTAAEKKAFKAAWEETKETLQILRKAETNPAQSPYVQMIQLGDDLHGQLTAKKEK